MAPKCQMPSDLNIWHLASLFKGQLASCLSLSLMYGNKSQITKQIYSCLLTDQHLLLLLHSDFGLTN